LLYEIVIHIQDKLLAMEHAPTIDIDNYQKVKSKFPVKCGPSLRHMDSKHFEGELISGLIEQAKMKQMFPYSCWRDPITRL
jgi:hypothetical protein